jgi:hypothetical protein
MSLNPRERREWIRQENDVLRTSRLILNRILIILYIVAMVLGVLMLRAAQDSLQRFFVYAAMAVGTGWILSRPLRDDPILMSLRDMMSGRRATARSCATERRNGLGERQSEVTKLADSAGFAPSQSDGPAQAEPPTERHRIDNLSELPPQLASNPDLLKLFQDAKNLGGSIWVGPPPQPKETTASPQNLPASVTSDPEVEEWVERARGLGGTIQVTRLGGRRPPASRVAGAPAWLILIVLCLLLGLGFLAYQSFVVPLFRR